VLQDFRGYIVYYREYQANNLSLKNITLCGDWMDRPEKNKDQRTNYMELMVEMINSSKNSLNKLTYGKRSKC
jgi:hypothetical protein